jgi:hypothetical protein
MLPVYQLVPKTDMLSSERLEEQFELCREAFIEASLVLNDPPFAMARPDCPANDLSFVMSTDLSRAVRC